MKKYYDYGDIEYKGIRDMRNLINLPIDEDYDNQQKVMMLLKAIILNMKVKEIKIKYCQLKSMTKPYLSNIINDHKTQVKWKVHSDNTESNYKSQE